MAANTKLMRSGRLAGLRRIYVSWLEDRPAPQQWIRDFVDRVRLETDLREEQFDPTLQTGDVEPGALEAQLFEPARGEPVTDIVGVMTVAYVRENTDLRGTLAAGELARFTDRVLADKADRMRVFLAPLEPPSSYWKVRGVSLSDATVRWLTWLKKERRFKWPTDADAGGSYADEIAAAVDQIVDKPDAN